MRWSQTLCLVLLLAVYLSEIQAIRRGFGKRFSKPSKGSSRSAVKDTTDKPTTPAPQDDTTAEGVEIKCQGFDLQLSETAKAHMKECAKVMGMASQKDLTVDKVPCFAKCLFEHKHLIDEDGKPHKENVLNIFSETVPENLKQGVKVNLEKCLDDHASMADPTDATCQTYTPLAMCVHMVYTDVCKTD